MRLYTAEQRLLWAILRTMVTEKRALQLVNADTETMRLERALNRIKNYRGEPSASHAEGSEMRQIASRALDKSA